MRLKKGFIKNKEGVAAIEFAIVGLPFFLIFMGIIEIGLTVFLDSSLNTAVRTVARQGIADGYSNYDEIKEILRGHMGGLYKDNCSSPTMTLRIIPFDDASDPQLQAFAQDPESIFTSSTEKCPTMDIADQRGKIVLYAAKYEWGGFTQLLSPLIPDNIYSITIVKNEAF